MHVCVYTRGHQSHLRYVLTNKVHLIGPELSFFFFPFLQTSVVVPICLKQCGRVLLLLLQMLLCWRDTRMAGRPGI